jgi:ribosomal protein S18 acetylase RimI-like enzyme
LAKNKDGIIIVYDYGFYAVRDSNQIKLADGTNTTFDGNNPDIRFDGGGMTYRQYADSQFNEEEDRYLASDYFENFEIKKESKENYPIIKIKNGLEYRKWGNTGIKVFDNDYIVAVADMKSIQVATQYQKKGIGLELVIILKEWNPNHRFGSMTPQGFNLMGKYYDTKIANNPDIRFDGGGEARLFTDDGNKLVVFNEYRNYNPYKIAVDDVNDANYITLWKTDTNTGKDKKVGSLKLNQTPDGFLSVSEISIDRNSKGLGLGLEMYMVALKYSSNKIKGIKSYLPNRSNKRQIPKIYRKLNSVKKGDYEFIYKENNPDIRFDGGGRINKTNPYIYDNPKLVKMIEDSIEKDGSSFICTYVASAVKMLEGSNVKIYGFSIYNNPDAEYFSDEEGDEGHHFAVLDDRYILDAWIYNNYQDYQANIKFNRSVFDLQNKEDKKIIKYLYGNRNKWVDITKNVEDFKDLFPLTYKDLINGYKNL